MGRNPVKLANIMSQSNADSADTLLLKETVQGISSLRIGVQELSALVASQIARSDNLVTGPAVYDSVSGSMVNPNLVNLSSLAHAGYAGGSFGRYGGEVFQPAIVPAESAGAFAANTLLRTASQPDEVPSQNPADSAATLLKKRRPEEQDGNK